MKKVALTVVLFLSLTVLSGCDRDPKKTETLSSQEKVKQEKILEEKKNQSSNNEKEVAEQESNFLVSTMFISEATWNLIDFKQRGQVNAETFVDYYVIDAQGAEKLTGKEAYERFKSLDRNGDGQLSKFEATGIL